MYVTSLLVDSCNIFAFITKVQLSNQTCSCNIMSTLYSPQVNVELQNHRTNLPNSLHNVTLPVSLRPLERQCSVVLLIVPILQFLSGSRFVRFAKAWYTVRFEKKHNWGLILVRQSVTSCRLFTTLKARMIFTTVLCRSGSIIHQFQVWEWMCNK